MIYKFQDGGASVPPFVSFTPVAVTRPRSDVAATTATNTASGNSKGKSDDVSLKDVLELIEKKIDALPNDASYIIHGAKQFFANSALGISPLGQSSTYNTSAIAMQYLNLLDNLTQAKHFKHEYDEAFKIVSANGGLNEVAVTTSGHLICQDPETGDFQLMTPKEQKENGYVALTNSQLLDLRALAPENAMNLDLIKTVANGVGTNTISKFIEDRLSNLGSDKLEREGYSKTEANKIVDGLNYLQQAASTVGDASLAVGAPMTIDGIYKYTTLSETQTKQALAAINYIFTTMPNNMKAVLESKAETMNLNEDGRGVYNLIFQYVGSKVNNTNSVNIQATKNANGADNVGDGLSGDNGKLTSAMMFVNGLTAGTQVTLRGIGTHGIEVYGNVVPLMADENTPLGANESLEKASRSNVAAILDWDNVTMGGQRIDANQFPLVKIDSNSFYRVFLPFDKNDPNKPDFALLDKVAEAHKELKAMGIDAMKPTAETIEKINQVYASKNLPLIFDNRGNLRISSYRAFGAVHGQALDRAFVNPDEAENSYYLNEINDTEKIEQILYNLKKSTGDEPNFSSNIFNRVFGGRDHMYDGMIYIPLRDSNLNAMYGTGYKPTAVEANTMYAKDGQINRQFMYNDGADMFAN